jgi:solute:Na+ symporter, SSS family
MVCRGRRGATLVRRVVLSLYAAFFMSTLDWLVLGITLLGIVCYGIWQSRGNRNIGDYLLADKQLPWYHVWLSVMATQASAVTFLSAPGQAYTSGMGFVQFYFGLPLAMIVLCVTFIPIFQRLNVYTAYEYLEKRFDIKTRTFTAFLFLLSRGLSTGISIYAPAIILSTILHLNIAYTTLIIGGIVIIYTVYGGTKAVSYTQVLQMGVIFGGMLLAGYMVVRLMPASVGFADTLQIAGKMGKTKVLDFQFDLSNRYNVWSGLIGGFFLQLSYFGTDQSQVGRYLTGKNITESRLGLILNGLLKIPMQFLILMLGAMVFAFYQYNQPPIFFNNYELQKVRSSPSVGQEFRQLEATYQGVFETKRAHITAMQAAISAGNDAAVAQLQVKSQLAQSQTDSLRLKAVELIKKGDASADGNDANYIFLNFVTRYLPSGMVGLLIAIIFLAAMGSLASGLNSLGSTTVIDFYQRLVRPTASDAHYLSVSRWATVAWGIFCIICAFYAHKVGNLIEAVNILGSLFYGVILGIFLVAFYLKKVKGSAVFWAAVVSECLVVVCWWLDLTAFLWLNLIGCVLVLILAWGLSLTKLQKA